MALDGIFLRHLTEELKSLIGYRADKIHQPSRDELVILLRGSGASSKLLISARSGSSRLHITSASFDNPADPPAFCKLLRRHISSAKITDISQAGLERVVKITFKAYNEMGDTIYPFLMVELITGRANIILCEESGRILDALHRSDIESSARLIQPGAFYSLPEEQEKANPQDTSAEELAERIISSNKRLADAFLATIDGVSPLVSRELAWRVSGDTEMASSELSEKQKDALTALLKDFKGWVSCGTPYLLSDLAGCPRDFSYIPIHQYGRSFAGAEVDSFSSLLDAFFEKRDREARSKALSEDILRLLTTAKNRAERRLAHRLTDLEKCENREQKRIFGELLKANPYAVEKGASSVRLQNYYDENLGFAEIPLDPSLSPSANASKYFKEYKKAHTAETALRMLIEKDREDIAYIDSVFEALSRCQGADDLASLREELHEAGYIRRNKKAKVKPAMAKPKEFSFGGFKILVGRNNRENDFITLKAASKSDLWFHAKNIPGSHVVILTEGKRPDEDTIIFAASLAAGHSKASIGDNVPVDFTEAKYVKKPSGAKPGMVIYSKNRTVFVKPRTK